MKFKKEVILGVTMAIAKLIVASRPPQKELL
jgi:hypothetical protein